MNKSNAFRLISHMYICKALVLHISHKNFFFQCTKYLSYITLSRIKQSIIMIRKKWRKERDKWFPNTARAMVLQATELLFYPTTKNENQNRKASQ